MKKTSFGNIILLVIAFFAIQTCFSQLSKTHYIPPLTAAEFGNANPEDQYFYISTPSLTDVAFTIKKVGLSSAFDITGIVSNANPQRIDLGTGYGQLFIPSNSTSQVVNSRGFIIEAEDVIYVSVRMNAGGGAQAGAMVSKGLTALDTQFRVGSFTNKNPGTNYLNFVSVMATEDNTNVTFDDLPAGLVIKNYTGSFPVLTTLNKGESYTIATNSSMNITNQDGLIGALVSSDKPIVVNCGSANGSFHNGGGRDYGLDQIVGTSKIGKEYIFVKGNGENGWENVLIVPHTSGTTLSINGSTPITITEKYFLIEGDQYNANGNMYVETSNDVFAYQGVGATNGEANQGMFFVPPLSCESRGNLDNIANIGDIGNTSYTGGISIVTKKGATVTINDLPISTFTTSGPHDITGNTEYITYKVTNLSGNISVQSTDELYCAYFNYNGSATSGSFYSGFPSAPEINFDLDFETLGNCIPNVTLSAANTENFDTYEWWYDDGSGFVNMNISTPDLTPNDPGTYKLIGVVTCSGLTLESAEVPVSICPDDTDIDGIIDNLDIDNDNDGILNCSESFGDQIINLSNISGGNLPVGGYSFSGDVNPIGDLSNSITGDVNGTITSNVNSKNGMPQSSVKYQLDFNKNLNIEFSGNSLLTDQDEFIIQVSNTKTITLVDPDDQLLVDTNYDGVFESGITQFSSFEIHFKIKGTSLANGAGTFKFVSNMVDYFSYKHKNLSETSSSSSSFIITATCVPLDSDSDGVNDDFDYDSENDGIPDRIEGTGTLKTLSGTDSNDDGLDDIFDIAAAPTDTDNDGVADYLDIDSDNDGIFDLEESGSGLADTDFNGVIDNILTTIGLNGWEDNVETSPDSGVINYTITNTDADALFNYIDGDSDGDICTDVIEAGFSDGNGNGYLGNSTVVVDTSGKVSNATDGYSTPNSDYITAGIINISQQPLDTEICELETTTITIETNTVDSYQWQLSTDGTNWTDIVDDIIYSNSKTNELTISNTPLSNNKYRVILTKIGNACGLISDEVTLTVNPLPIANPVIDLFECDDLTDSDDTNGIVQKFDLESQTNTILGSQLPVEYTVTYYASQGDADSGTSALISPYTNISNPQIIYTRVENIASGCFVSNITFNLNVNPLPIANPVANIFECDNLNDGDDTNGVVQNFDLENQTSTILGTQLATDFTVTYHLSDAEAISGANPLTSPHSNSLSPNSQTIFVRIQNNNTGCINPHLNFNVVVNPLPIANTVLDLELCDNLDDSNDTNGIIQTWNLESQTNTILGTQSTTDYTVTYHLSDADAISGNNALISPHSNTASPNNQTIYVRVLNNITGCINTHINFEIIVHPLPIIVSSANLTQCDDDSNDGISYFNLNESNILIKPDFTNETFKFYKTKVGAETSDPIELISDNDAISFEASDNTVVYSQIITPYGCFRVGEITLFVEPTQLSSSFQRSFYKCDDYLDPINDDRDGIATFDFSSVTNEIYVELNTDASRVKVTYYENQEDALSEENEIIPSNYRNTNYPILAPITSLQIYVRVDSYNENACIGLGPHVNLFVEALPIANLVTIERQCDDDADGMFPFDVSNIEATVLSGQTNVTVNYFDEAGNALSSPLPNPFLTNSQTITIQVSNNTTLAPDGPCYDETTLEFIVDKSPVAYPITILPACDDESNDGVYDFDTSTIQSTILGSQTGMEVHYFNQIGDELPSPLPNPFTTSTQSITVEVINPLNTTCIATSTLDFTVNPLPDFEVISDQIICITDPVSTISLNVYQDNPKEVLDYEWKNASGTLLSTNKTLDVTIAGTYFVTLIKTDGTLCSRTKSIEVIPSMVATITQDEIIVEDDTDNNTITIITDNLGIGDYEFAIDEPFLFQDEPFFDYVEAGIHTIFIQDKNNCGVSQIDVSVIGFPKFITPNNDGFNDKWNVIGIDTNKYPTAKIYIFDRFGKLITVVDPDSEGWDGVYNGEYLPSTDYWFSVELIDSNGNSRIRKGHFTLIRK